MSAQTELTDSLPAGDTPVSRLARWLADNRGTAAVTFILCLPIFLSIVAILVQYALLANGRNVVTNASERAARSAVTALPEDRYDEIRRSACLALAQISPPAKTAPDPEAVAVADALSRAGVAVDSSFAARYTYAMQATTIEYPPIDYRHHRGVPVDVTVRYKFYLTVPGAMTLLGVPETSIAGVNGRFRELSAVIHIQTAHGREAAADGRGWPAGVGGTSNWPAGAYANTTTGPDFLP